MWNGKAGIHIAALLALFATCAMATAEDSILERPRWRFFRDPEDIPTLYVNGIVSNVDENIWLATRHSLVHYDGAEFVREEIPIAPTNTEFTNLLFSADRTLWVGTTGGVLRYAADRWTYPLRSGRITALAESADGVICVGVSPDEDRSFRPSPPRAAAQDNRFRERFQRFARRSDPGPEIESVEPGLYCYKRGTWTHRELPAGCRGSRIHMLFADQDGGMWAVLGDDDYTEGVYRLFNGEWEDMRTSLRMPGGTVLTIAQTRDGGFWFGTAHEGVWNWKDGHWQLFTELFGIKAFTAATLLAMPDGSLWAAGSPAGILFKYKHGAWRQYPVRDVGVTGHMITHMMYSIDDTFWFVIPGRGVARFDRRGGPWWIYDRKHGLPHAAGVSAFAQAPGGPMWVGTTAGLFLSTGNYFTRPPLERGVSEEPISALVAWNDGRIWASASSPESRPGIWQYDGAGWSRVPTPPALTSAFVNALLIASNGDVWAATGGARSVDPADVTGHGVFRLSRGTWTQFTSQSGLPSDYALSLSEAPGGAIWVGTDNGLASFRNGAWSVYTNQDGLTTLHVSAVCATDSGVWVGGRLPEQGVSYYSGGVWETFTVDSGLASHDVWSIAEDEDGNVWFGTALGVSRYDGSMWTTFTSANGLADDNVWAASLARDGSVWFGHFDGAITRYLASSGRTPKIVVDEIPTRVAYPGFLSIIWRGRDMWDRTMPGDLLYSWRLDDGEWSPFSHATSHTIQSLPAGDHRFFVRAVDQEGNVGAMGTPVEFAVDVPFWLSWQFVVPIFLATVVIGVVGATAIQRSRKLKKAQAQLVGELQRELHVAQSMQKALLPQSDPHHPSLEVASMCRPASQVGGDYFTYLWSEKDSARLGIVIADVTGHAMEAAIPAVLFSGMLAATSKETGRPSEMLNQLNESLETQTSTHTFICCTIAVFDMNARVVSVANAGGLDPIRKRDGFVELIESEGARLPLGILGNIAYEEKQVALNPGDVFVFLTDGIIEARSPENEMFGFERALDVVARSHGASHVKEQLIQSALSHMRGQEQDDDFTLLAVRVTS